MSEEKAEPTHLWASNMDDDGYADVLFLSGNGPYGVGINCGGHVIIKPLREWHALAAAANAEPVAWQPIETAPHEGERILVVGGGAWPKPELVLPDGRWWRMRRDQGSKGGPTHWMPVPEFRS